MTTQSPERSGSVPGRGWYAVAVLVFLAGMAVFAVFLNEWQSKFGDDFVRVAVPGQAELPLYPGSYTIFHERGGMTDGTGGGVSASFGEGGDVTAIDVAGLGISVLKTGSGTAVLLIADARSRYTLDGRSGQSLFTFTLTEPGTYRFVAAFNDGRTGSQAVLALARGFVGNLLKTVLEGLAIGFGSIAVALAIGIYVYRRRRSALGPPIQYVSNRRIRLAFYFDLTTAWLLGVFVAELLTGLLAKGGFSLPVWPWVLMLVVMGGYFVVADWFSRTLWEHILKTRPRPNMET